MYAFSLLIKSGGSVTDKNRRTLLFKLKIRLRMCKRLLQKYGEDLNNGPLINGTIQITDYSGDLNSELVQYSNGPLIKPWLE